jgi:creatinine amidohydrolase/Fe(II)-dependent formamide hydrolase-like protein
MKPTIFAVLVLCASAFAQQQPQRTVPTSAGPAPAVDISEMPLPVPALDSVFMEELTMLEIRDAIKAGKTSVLVVSGGVEQNGPYLATSKHNDIMRVNAESIARSLGNALVAPLILLQPGNPERATEPGTIFLSLDSYKAIIADTATSLTAQGFKNILLMSDNAGGAQSGMKDVADALNAKWNGNPARVTFVPEYFNYADVGRFTREELGIDERNADGFHDNYYMSAMTLAADPAKARMEERIRAAKFTINGVNLAPASRTIENGRKIIAFRTAATVAAIRKAIQ